MVILVMDYNSISVESQSISVDNYMIYVHEMKIYKAEHGNASLS